MSKLPFTYVIGLEVHAELSTKTKMFCRCPNQPFGAEPNQHTCPVCMGLPGTLPIPNREAVRKTVLVGKALGSEIPKLCKFDRKHYFYPDLPKGYQISQYDLPLCVGGSLELLDEKGEVSSVVEFERVHLEEDAGKLMHTGKSGYTKVDLNRAGVPLIEMVTKPVLTSPEQARTFMQELRLMVRTLGVSDADMEKGHMRCDVNVSIKFEHEGKEVWTPITEVKNVNSTRAVERSLIVEGQRMYDEWLADGPIRQRTGKVTAGWDEDTNTVRINRTKEAAKDYRYFPEPDIPPLAVYDQPDLDPGSMELPVLPNQLRRQYLAEGIAYSDVELFLADRDKLAKLRLYQERGLPVKQVANWLVNIPLSEGLEPDTFAELLDLVSKGEIGFSKLKELMEPLSQKLETMGTREAAKELGLLQVHDDAAVQAAIEAVFTEQAKAVEDYKAGNEKILGFIVGQVMKRAAGKAQPQKVQEMVKAALAA